MGETIDVELGGHHIQVVNLVNPIYMKATRESLEWLVNELHKDATSVRDGVVRELVGEHVVVAPDSDDEDEAKMELMSKIETMRTQESLSATARVMTQRAKPTMNVMHPAWSADSLVVRTIVRRRSCVYQCE